MDDTLARRAGPSTRAGAPGPDGIAFPVDGGGGRNSIVAGKRLLAEAVQVAAPPLAEAIMDEPDWRNRYPAHIRAQVELSVRQPTTAVSVARRGLDTLYRSFEFVRGGEAMPIDLALRATCANRLYTVTVPGRGTQAPRLEVPYRGQVLSGSALLAQVHDWVERGLAEPSFAAAIETLIARPDWLDLSDWNIALLGAGAPLSPYATLASWRANLAVVDAPGAEERWRRLIDIARRGNGRVRVPVSAGSSADDPRLPDLAGADLLSAAPQIRNWLAPMPEPLAIGNYAFPAGEAQVRTVVAMDAILADLLALRRAVVPLFMLAATDCHAVPAHTAELALNRWRNGGALRLWQDALRWTSRGRLFAPNVAELIDATEGFRAGIVDALLLEHGPNYALARRLQQWRALVMRADGLRVSANVVPLAHSVLVPPTGRPAAACRGLHRFGIEVFEPETVSALLAAMLVFDLRTDSGAAAPGTTLAQPLQFLADGALHGGLWTSPFAPRSLLPVAALLGRLA